MQGLFSLLVCLLISATLTGQQAFPFNSIHGSTQEAVKIHIKNEIGDKSFLETHMPKGKTYLVSIWATWCGSCRGELRAMEKIHCDWADQYDLEFLAISIDTPTDHTKVFSMADKMNWNFKIIHEEYGYLLKELDIFRLPRMFLVDRDGNIVYEPNGYSTSALKKLKEKIASI